MKSVLYETIAMFVGSFFGCALYDLAVSGCLGFHLVKQILKRAKEKRLIDVSENLKDKGDER